MIFQDDREGQRRRKAEPDADAPSDSSEDRPQRSRTKRAAAGEVGDALRSVYQRAVDEDIPPEMLDLLGKLG